MSGDAHVSKGHNPTENIVCRVSVLIEKVKYSGIIRSKCIA